MSIDKLIGDTIKEKDDLGRSFLRPGSVTEYFQVFQDSFEPTMLYTIQGQRNLGSSFILGHPVWGFIGSGTPHIVTGSQPYLGDSRDSTFTTKQVSSPFNKFKEYFVGSRFNETGITTATGWGVGSLVFGAAGADIGQSTEIYLGSENLSAARMTVVGSTNLDFSLAANGSQFESVALGSTYSFTNTGSDLRWKAEGSNAYLTKVQVEYNI